MTTEELRESILSAPKNGYTKLSAEQRNEMEAYALRYRAFMDACKTEREATAWATKMAEKHGFVPAVPGMEVKPGDKIYFNNRGKSFMIAVIGKGHETYRDREGVKTPFLERELLEEYAQQIGLE